MATKHHLGIIARLILHDLSLAADGLLPFTIYRRHRLSPADITLALSQLLRKGLTEIEGKRIFLTAEGLAIARTARSELYPSEARPWRECPAEFKREALTVNAPYVPQIHLLDKASFRVAWRRKSRD